MTPEVRYEYCTTTVVVVLRTGACSWVTKEHMPFGIEHENKSHYKHHSIRPGANTEPYYLLPRYCTVLESPEQRNAGTPGVQTRNRQKIDCAEANHSHLDTTKPGCQTTQGLGWRAPAVATPAAAAVCCRYIVSRC